MSIGLDIGNTRLRSLRRSNYRLIGRHCRSAYISMPVSTSSRRLLDRLHVPYHILEAQLIVLGDSIDDLAELFRIPVTRLMPHVGSTTCTTLRRQIITKMAETLLPESTQRGEVCCFTGGLSDELGDEFGRQLTDGIRQRGYRPLRIGSATAVVLAELGNHALTGVGVTLGSARCEVALVRHGVELARSVVERGGDWIDEQLATGQSLVVWDRDGNQQLDVRGARAWKESNAGPMLTPESAQELQFAALYRELVGDVVEAIHHAFDTAPDAFDAVPPVSIVCAGGTASRPGFREVVLGELRKNPVPFAVEQVRVIRSWDYSPSRGCLIRAELEEQTLQRRAA